jgi:hypothetical protein
MILENFNCSYLYDSLIEKGICPECMGDIKPAQVGYEKYEAWGSTFNEPTYINKCEQCGIEFDE